MLCFLLYQCPQQIDVVFPGETNSKFLKVKGITYLRYVWIQSCLQAHRSRLDKFREMVMPRQFLRNFRVEPENTVIVDKLSDINERYDKLKVKSNEHTQRIMGLLALHDKYRVSVETLVVWIDDTQHRINELSKEPIAESADGVTEQMDQLRVSRDMMRDSFWDVRANSS